MDRKEALNAHIHRVLECTHKLCNAIALKFGDNLPTQHSHTIYYTKERNKKNEINSLKKSVFKT